jgi:FixJ family two-component response regulator
MQNNPLTAPATHRQHNVGKLLVFVVDDDPAVRNSLQFALELEGYAVRTFADAEQLLGRTDRERPCCLVIDYGLPGSNGLELLRSLRQQDVAAPAILITSHPNRLLRERAEHAGVPIVEKPLLADTLTDEIRAICVHGAETP